MLVSRPPGQVPVLPSHLFLMQKVRRPPSCPDPFELQVRWSDFRFPSRETELPLLLGNLQDLAVIATLTTPTMERRNCHNNAGSGVEKGHSVVHLRIWLRCHCVCNRPDSACILLLLRTEWFPVTDTRFVSTDISLNGRKLIYL